MKLKEFIDNYGTNTKIIIGKPHINCVYKRTLFEGDIIIESTSFKGDIFINYKKINNILIGYDDITYTIFIIDNYKFNKFNNIKIDIDDNIEKL